MLYNSILKNNVINHLVNKNIFKIIKLCNIYHQKSIFLVQILLN
jgi:hypothetical protein